jgi:hypothetical protein
MSEFINNPLALVLAFSIGLLVGWMLVQTARR